MMAAIVLELKLEAQTTISKHQITIKSKCSNTQMPNHGIESAIGHSPSASGIYLTCGAWFGLFYFDQACGYRLTKRHRLVTLNRQTEKPLAAVWQQIDRIFCISLADRRDRQASARQAFSRAGLDGLVTFYLARRHPHDCEQGIFESHQACLKMGLDAGARTMLVFEDDVVFGRLDACRLEAGIRGFMDHPGWPIMHLGCLAAGSRATHIPAVRRIRYRCLTHACLIRRDLARRIVDTPYAGIPYDGLLRCITDAHVALYPSVAFQSNSPSDNRKHRFLDRVRRLFGGLRIIQMVNEHYLRFRPAVIVVHLLAAGAAIAWLLV
jgi:hypothetical protein